MPAILAALALSGIFGFLCCGVSTWWLYGQRGELALKTTRGSLIPAVEQSLLSPEEKSRTVRMLEELADELERGNLENAEAAGVMQRLTRLPILQWGQIRRIESFVDDHPDDFDALDSLQFDRLRKGVERDKLTTIDFVHILTPVLQSSTDQLAAPLIDKLDVQAVADVVERAKTAADRIEIEASPKSDVTIDTLVRRQIEAGIEKGTF